MQDDLNAYVTHSCLLPYYKNNITIVTILIIIYSFIFPDLFEFLKIIDMHANMKSTNEMMPGTLK